MFKLFSIPMIGLAAFAAGPAEAVTIRELAQYEQPALVAHIMGSVTGVAAGFKLIGNRKAVDCIHLWAAPPASGSSDPKALTDILTLIAEELGKLGAGKRPPEYEDVLAAAIRKQCGSYLPSAG